MTFKDLEKWEQEGIIDSLKPGENPYVEYTKDDIIAGLKKKNQKLKKQLEYLRNGEYLNQLKFERNVLKDVVNKGEVSEEDKQFIDCTHRNTELLAQQKEFIEYLEEKLNMCDGFLDTIKSDLEEIHYAGRISGKSYITTKIMKNETAKKNYEDILSKYKEIIGGDNK